jgi:hypothetical protein
MKLKGWIPLCAFVLGAGLGCSDTTLVTVSGAVATLDDLSPAPDACVFVLDQDDTYISEPTNAQGEFTIEVPAGTPFLLTVDDCTNRMQNNMGTYYPTINADVIWEATIDENKEGWPLHVGTNISAVADGANATWENYFDNATVEADKFDPIQSVYDEDLAGFVFFGSFWINTSSMTFFEDFQTGQSVAISDANCPVGYINNGTTFDVNGYPDPTLGPNVLQDGGTSTDGSGNVISFCNGDAGETVDITLTSPGNTVQDEETTYSNIPIRDSACTVLFPASIDGTKVHIGDVFALFAG